MKLTVVMNYEICTEIEVVSDIANKKTFKAELDELVDSIELPSFPGLQWTYTTVLDEDDNEVAEY